MARIRRAVFPAAGLGTRFLPATKAQAKEMLPLVDKPILQYAVEEAVASGLESLVIVTSRGKGAIEDHFDVSWELEKNLEERGKPELLRAVRAVSDLARIAYIRQGEALGLGHAVLTARDLVGGEPFAVLLGDDVIIMDAGDPPCTRQLMDIHERHGAAVVAVMEVPEEETGRYGIVRARPLGEEGVFEVEDMVEKPAPGQAPSRLAIIGRYILPPSIFPALEETGRGSGGEIQLTDGLRHLLGRERVLACRFRGRRLDAGDKLGFLQATVELALRHGELGSAFGAWLRSLDLEGY
ncbi:MAG: UTP--glucose-1-phosphate uridylyltransferase GalU [Acidobacteria bacterium]|nr:UTP--glucose-1-phosphate uridylyltransferase GalU [Acidobacteriota bacterium]